MEADDIHSVPPSVPKKVTPANTGFNNLHK